MKNAIKELILSAVGDAHAAGRLNSPEAPGIEVEAPKSLAHGDLSTNAAMVMARHQKMAPRKIAETIMDHLKDRENLIEKMEIAGPGFINFFIRASAWHQVVRTVLEQDRRYGASCFGAGQKVQVEFVSANPTGPLHVGHGRGAVAGDTVANILSFTGHEVQREYYINDSGRQIETLGRSVFLRYQALFRIPVHFPETCYQGRYIVTLAEELKAEKGDALLRESEDKATQYCARLAADRILAGIRKDLEDFGVRFDRWFSEQSLFDEDKVLSLIDKLRARGLVYENEGALWFRTTNFGDEKDRVVVRQNNVTTYFASDIAYHFDKFGRGFDRVIDVWGADHHGYVARLTGAIEAGGHHRDRFQVILVKLVNLLRAGQPVAMSTRSGEFVTLAEVISEVGKDAARFIFLTRSTDSPLDFDLELAKKKTNDNPVYYVQYVHARISSIVRKARESSLFTETLESSALDRLSEPEEVQLMKCMGRFPEVVEQAARNLEPHRITFFLMELAAAFHAYYNKHRVLVPEEPLLTHGRLALVRAVRGVIRNGLTLLGVDAPEKM